jgi:NADH-quinone oxidoreductase subunit L
VLAARKGLLYTFFYNKWYFDELYDFLFVRPAKRLGRFLWKVGDGMIIDGLGPDGIAAACHGCNARRDRLQSGYVYHYAFAMLMAWPLFVTWFLFSGNA